TVVLPASAVPATPTPIAFMMQTERLAMGPGTGTGGPKKQLASRSHAPIGVPPTHWLSALHAPVPSVPGAPFRQCRAGPAPRVQSVVPLDMSERRVPGASCALAGAGARTPSNAAIATSTVAAVPFI